MIAFFKQYIPYYEDYKTKFIYVLVGIVLVAMGTSGTAYTFGIAHRLSTIKNADRITVFKEGKIVCMGSEEELKRDCGEYRKLIDDKVEVHAL